MRFFQMNIPTSRFDVSWEALSNDSEAEPNVSVELAFPAVLVAGYAIQYNASEIALLNVHKCTPKLVSARLHISRILLFK